MVPRFISGHGMFSCGHRSCASDQISRLDCVWHCVSIWDIDSVVLQAVQVSRSSYPGMFNQYSPTMWVLCIVLYRNCCISGRIIGFLRLCQMVALVSGLPVKLLIAS